MIKKLEKIIEFVWLENVLDKIFSGEFYKNMIMCIVSFMQMISGYLLMSLPAVCSVMLGKLYPSLFGEETTFYGIFYALSFFLIPIVAVMILFGTVRFVISFPPACKCVFKAVLAPFSIIQLYYGAVICAQMEADGTMSGHDVVSARPARYLVDKAFTRQGARKLADNYGRYLKTENDKDFLTVYYAD